MIDGTAENIGQAPSPHERGSLAAPAWLASTLPGGEGQGKGLRVSPEVAKAVAGWLTYLGGERRYAENTLEAYERDSRQFFTFIGSANQQPVSLRRLDGLTTGDFRAFLAARRDEGAGSRSLAR